MTAYTANADSFGVNIFSSRFLNAEQKQPVVSALLLGTVGSKTCFVPFIKKSSVLLVSCGIAFVRVISIQLIIFIMFEVFMCR